jgi:hypothetical protein
MHNRFFTFCVLGLWLAMMGWLGTQKVLPSYWVGQPPTYKSIIAAKEDEPPVGWEIWVNDRKIGWAISGMEKIPQEMKEITSQVHFDELPLNELMAGWGKDLLRKLMLPGEGLELDARSSLTFDPLGKLIHFDSSVQFEPWKTKIRMQGSVEGSQLHVQIHAAEMTYTTEVAMPQNALLSDSLSPQTEMPNLRKGQSWTVPVFTPLHPSESPLEILHATVEGKELLSWNGGICDAWLVVYRRDPGSGFGDGTADRGKLWVLGDGRVIKQQSSIFNSTISFVRLSRGEAALLVKRTKERESRPPGAIEEELP